MLLDFKRGKRRKLSGFFYFPYIFNKSPVIDRPGYIYGFAILFFIFLLKFKCKFLEGH